MKTLDGGGTDVTYYAYYIKEMGIEDFDSTSSVSTTSNGDTTTTTTTLTNKKKPEESKTSLKIQKEWRRDDGTEDGAVIAAPVNTVVTYQVYRYTSDKPIPNATKITAGGEPYDIRNGWGGYDWNWHHITNLEGQPAEDGLYQLGVNNDWSGVTFENLPEVEIVNGKAQYYAYYVEEIDLAENVTAKYEITRTTTDGTNAYTVKMTNTLHPEETFVEVEKKWTVDGEKANFAADGETAKNWPDDIRIVVKLFRDGEAYPNAEKQQTVTLTSTNQSDTFTGLPKDDGNGNVYVYTVTETIQKKDGDNWEDITTVSYNRSDLAVASTITGEAGGYLLTNNLTTPGTLKVTKTIGGSKSGQVAPSKISFTVTGPNGTVATFTYADMTGDSDPKVKELTGLAPGTYTVTEQDQNTGLSRTTTYTVTPAGTSEAGTSTTGSSASAVVEKDKTTVVAFNNTYEESNGMELTIKKQWDPDPGDNAQATFKIHQLASSGSGTAAQEYDINSNNMTLSANVGDILKITGKSKNPHGGDSCIVNGNYIYVQGDATGSISKEIILGNDHIVGGQVSFRFNSTYFLDGNPTVQIIPAATETSWTQTVILKGNLSEITVNGLPESDGDRTYSYWVEEVSCIPNTYSGSYNSTVGSKTSPISASSADRIVSFNNTRTTPGTAEFTVKKAWEGADESTLQDKVVTFELLGIRKASDGDGPIPVKPAQQNNNTGVSQLNTSAGDVIQVEYLLTFRSQNDLESYKRGRLDSNDSNTYLRTKYLYNDGSNDTSINAIRGEYTVDEANLTITLPYSFTVQSSDYRQGTKTIELEPSLNNDNWAMTRFVNSSAAPVDITLANYTNQTAVEGVSSGYTVTSFGEFTLSYSDIYNGQRWSKHFSGLSDQYIYYAVEKSVDGSTVLDTYNPLYDIKTTSETVTNTVPGPKTVTVSAHKEWDDTTNTARTVNFGYHPTVTFTLYRKALAADETAPTEAQKLEIAKAISEGQLTGIAAGYGIAAENTAGFNPKRTVSGTETVTWENLSAEDANGNKYVYVVVESNVPHYELTGITGDGTATPYSLINTLKPETLDLTIQKQWKEFGADVTSDSRFDSAYIKYKVMKLTYTDEARTQQKEGTTATAVSITDPMLRKQSTVTITNEDGTTTTLPWAAMVINLPKMTITGIKADGTFEAEYYKYYVEETAYSIDGTTEVTEFSDSAAYTVSYQVDGGMVLNAATQEYFDMAKDAASLTISNSNNEMTLDVLKTDLDGKPLTGAKFKLERYNTAESAYENVVVTGAEKRDYTYSAVGGDNISEMEVGDDGKLHIKKLPVGIYRLTETEAPKNYVSSDDPFIFQIEGGSISPVSHKTITYKDNIVNVPNTPEAELVIKKTINGPDGITEEQKKSLLSKITFVIDDVTEGIEDKERTPGFTKTFETPEAATTGMKLSTTDGILFGHTYRVTEVIQDDDGAYKFKQVSYVKNEEETSTPAKTTSTPVDGIAMTNTGTIPVKGVVVFTNEYEGRIDLSLTKKVEGAPTSDADKQFQFTVKLNDLTVNNEDRNLYHTVITAADGTTKSGSSVVQEKNATEATVTVMLRQNETWTVKDLPNDTTYEITEKSYTEDGYVPLVTSGALSGPLAANSGTTAVEVTNYYSETIVTKIWNDLTANKVEWPTEITSITLNLTRLKGTEADEEFTPVPITITKTADGFEVSGNPKGTTASVVLKDTEDAKQGYSLVIKGLEKNYLDGNEVKTYTYKFSELPVQDYSPIYGFETGNFVDAKAAPEGGTITNRKAGGYELPQTGGIGTTLFTALGGLMTATAGAILTIKSWHRRKQNT